MLQKKIMQKKSKVFAVLIAYNAADTLRKFYKELPKTLLDEILLFDDASQDKTYELSKKLKIKSYRNPVNLGYGGNLKKAINTALSRGADIIIDIHPDGEYKTGTISQSLKLAKNGSELVLGNRFYDANYVLTQSGMRFWKFIPIIMLNWVCRAILATNVHDLHQGFRVYSKNLFSKIDIEKYSNSYLFSFELTSEAVFAKAKISEIPVKAVYKGKKRGASLNNSMIYTIGVIKVLSLFISAKLGFHSNLFRDATITSVTKK